MEARGRTGEKPGPIGRRAQGRMNRIDMGIGLCCLWAGRQESWRFTLAENTPKLEGYLYVGTVEI